MFTTSPEKHKEVINRGQHDMVLWGLMERNRYLEEKIERLRKQYEKQSRTINKIESSDKWKNKNKCGPDRCYQQKYMQLLRVRSPFF